MRLIGCPETSVTTNLRWVKNPKARRSHLHRGGSLKSRTVAGALFRMVRRPRREADQSSHLMRRLRMRGNIPTLHHKPSWRAGKMLPLTSSVTFLITDTQRVMNSMFLFIHLCLYLLPVYTYWVIHIYLMILSIVQITYRRITRWLVNKELKMTKKWT
jgi:hypothetical protein